MSKAKTSLGRAVRALSTTLMMQLWLAALAGLNALVAGPVLDQKLVATSDLRGLAEVLAREPDLLRAFGFATLSVTVTHLVALPAMQLAWLFALAHGQGSGPSLRFGLTHYGAALRQSALVLVVALLGAAALCAVPVYVWGQVSSEAEPTQRAAMALSLLPLLLWGLWCHLWHDLSRAHLATFGRLRLGNLLALWAEPAYPSRFLGFGLHVVLSVPLLLAAQAVYLQRPNLTGLTIAQALLLGRSFVRSVWLARATRLAEAGRVAELSAGP